MKDKIKYIAISLIVAILMIIATFEDLDIAKKIYNPNMIWAHIFKVIGELPIYIGMLLFGVTHFHLIDNKTWKSFFAVETFISSALFILMPGRYVFDINVLSVGIMLLMALVVFFGVMKLSYKIEKSVYRKMKTVTTIFFVGVLIQLVTIYFLKFMWSRVRFFELAGDYSNFTRWYVINWFEGNHNSFPSGHTSGATNILYLSLFVPLFSDDKKKKYIAEGLCFAFIVLTAISRMVLGKHYLSDVTMGFAITYFIHIIVTKSIKDRQKTNKVI